MASVHFTKMHGAGNDYIYVDTSLYSIPDPAEAARAWSRPHFGIGSDGLVLIGAPSDPAKADWSMRIFNADGSEAMMCGNASRCIGKYLYDKGLTHNTDIRLETPSGVKLLHLHLDGKGTVGTVTVDMLEPRFHVPGQFLADLDPVGRAAFRLPKTTGHLFVSMGNPHYVLFTTREDDLDKIDKYGKLLERDAAFPERCNIEMALPVGKDRLRTRVWERGSGITMACGTGACATAVAAARLGLASRSADIDMDGGTLHIDWAADNHVRMTGPAAFAFEGDVALPGT